jgi:hypothetical protein
LFKERKVCHGIIKPPKKNKGEANEIQCMNFLKQFFLAVVFLMSTMVKQAHVKLNFNTNYFAKHSKVEINNS